ncbi:MAG: hypothetical protein QME78_08390 [Thermodesulfobacteriota bacterium]|nr:hypothetical protein [Thermodesulfobacteriota bacterium]
MTISEAVIKIESLMEKDKKLARRIEDMKSNLMKRVKKKDLITVALRAPYGSGCLNSPYKKHEHVGDEQHCIFCGSTAYGSGCLNSPHKKHQHGSSGNKCVYCGSTATGSGCLNSPVGKHMK